MSTDLNMSLYANGPGGGRCYSSVAVFLLGALALVVPSGYTYGAALLLLGGLVQLWRRPRLDLVREDYMLMAALAGYSLLFMLQLWLEGAGSSAFDRPSRFLFAVPALLFVLAYPPRLAWLWSGLVVGAVAVSMFLPLFDLTAMTQGGRL